MVVIIEEQNWHECYKSVQEKDHEKAACENVEKWQGVTREGLKYGLLMIAWLNSFVKNGVTVLYKKKGTVAFNTDCNGDRISIIRHDGNKSRHPCDWM